MIQKMTRRPRGFRIAQVVCERGVRNLHTACRPPAEAVLGAARKAIRNCCRTPKLLLYNRMIPPARCLMPHFGSIDPALTGSAV